MENGKDQSTGMYAENILDHYKNPRNKGVLENPSVTHEEFNPLCGDRIRLQLKVDAQGTIVCARFLGTGCAISQASASMLVEQAEGKTLKEVRAWSKEDVLDWLGIPIGPVRLKCALLALDTLKNALEILNKMNPSVVQGARP